MNSESIYQQRIEQFSSQAELLATQSSKFTLLRTVAFLLALASLGPAVFGVAPWTVCGVVALSMFVVFAMLVHRHEAIRGRLRVAEELRQLNQQSLGRCRREWEKVPFAPIEPPAPHAALAADLDLFGRASVFHWLNQAHTPLGVNTLRDWLCVGAAPLELLPRQQAVEALAKALELRQQLVVRGGLAAGGVADPQALLDWSRQEDWLSSRPWLIWLSRLLPVIAAVLYVISVYGIVPGSSCLLVLVINLGITFAFAGRIHGVFSQISSHQGEALHFSEMCATARQLTLAPQEGTILLLEQLRADLQAHGGAQSQLARLGAYANFANLRYSPLVYFLVQVLTLWDFHLLLLMEKWRRECGQAIHHWFTALGELEALCSLAAVRFDNPQWAWPEFRHDDQVLVEAKALGHPLLPPDVRVANDVVVGPSGRVLLVTGSNMSGKSTLLRSLGVNVMLAQAGAPACAADLKLPPVTVVASMRVHDSLEDGVSFFMAELNRLKEIVDLARRRQEHEPTVFYLLDEILQGTNSAERQIAVRTVIGHLVREGAIGAVSTHDLELASAAPLDQACHPVHFRETLHDNAQGLAGAADRTMTFDYRLRPGVAPTTNALKLLEMVGLAERAI